MSKKLVDQIKETLEAYPDMSFDEKRMIVSGNYSLVNTQTGDSIEDYNLSIFFPIGVFSTTLPRVKELGGKIPRLIDRHIYPKGTFCLTTRLYEYIICRNGITFAAFLESIVRPFLATQTLLSLGEISRFPQGEFSHGGKGILEGYQDYLKLESEQETIDTISAVISKIGRNKKCFCGSGKKYKDCHLKIVQSNPLPNTVLLRKDLKTIKDSDTLKSLLKPQLP